MISCPKESLQNLLKKVHELGMRGVADIVINHRCGDQQDAQGRWNVFTSTGASFFLSLHVLIFQHFSTN